MLGLAAVTSCEGHGLKRVIMGKSENGGCAKVRLKFVDGGSSVWGAISGWIGRCAR